MTRRRKPSKEEPTATFQGETLSQLNAFLKIHELRLLYLCPVRFMLPTKLKFRKMNHVCGYIKEIYVDLVFHTNDRNVWWKETNNQIVIGEENLRKVLFDKFRESFTPSVDEEPCDADRIVEDAKEATKNRIEQYKKCGALKTEVIVVMWDSQDELNRTMFYPS